MLSVHIIYLSILHLCISIYPTSVWVNINLYSLFFPAISFCGRRRPFASPHLFRDFHSPCFKMMVYLDGSCARNSHQNDLMIDKLHEKNLVKSKSVMHLMKNINRSSFCPGVPRQFAFADSTVSIGYSARMSSPSHYARALELLERFLPPGGQALDVGCGSGYMTACLATLAGTEGTVIGIDHVHPLIEQATRNVFKLQYPKYLFESGNLQFYSADGRLGWLTEAPYNVIYVGKTRFIDTDALPIFRYR